MADLESESVIKNNNLAFMTLQGLRFKKKSKSFLFQLLLYFTVRVGDNISVSQAIFT